MRLAWEPVPVVLMSPGLEVLPALEGGFVAAGIGPFAQGGLDEALRLDVGLGAIRLVRR